jgi:type I restriction enzyme R subunit
VLGDRGGASRQIPFTREELGLSEEEVAFYNVISQMKSDSFENKFIAELIHKVVKVMKTKFQPDWKSPHRGNVLSSVTLSVRKVLMDANVSVEQLGFLTKAIVDQAKEQYRD